MHTNPLQTHIESVVRIALDEDVGDGDITANLISDGTNALASIICREQAVICGKEWFEEVFRQLPGDVQITWQLNDGDRIVPDQEICQLTGDARTLLTGERTALNFLQTLSATATLTRQYADKLIGTNTRLQDTRKTLPGLRLAQKYAVVCGGGYNHRIGLFDAFLIKENHIIAAGGIAEACALAREIHADKLLEIEVESIAELQQAIAAQVDRVLLDNFDLDMMREAVTINQGQVELEASGNVSETTLRNIAETGVDFISVGALTKNIQAVDLSMRLVGESENKR